MPPRSARRDLLADTAIALLAERGAHGLTHRAVDAAAGVPTGTTSNFFSSRRALLEAAARRLATGFWSEIERVSALFEEPTGREGVLRMLVGLVEAADQQPVRQCYLARYELTLESGRQPALREILMEERAESSHRGIRAFQKAGLSPTDTHIEMIGSLLAGLVFDRVTTDTMRLDVVTVTLSAALAVIPLASAAPAGEALDGDGLDLGAVNAPGAPSVAA